MKIKTDWVCYRNTRNHEHDWFAFDDDTYDGPGCPLGSGATEQAAITDLLDQLQAKHCRCVNNGDYCDWCEDRLIDAEEQKWEWRPSGTAWTR